MVNLFDVSRISRTFELLVKNKNTKYKPDSNLTLENTKILDYRSSRRNFRSVELSLCHFTFSNSVKPNLSSLIKILIIHCSTKIF